MSTVRSTGNRKPRNRTSPGVREGGQYATEARGEPEVNLDRTDRYGFPVTECGRCDGHGKSQFSSLHRHSRCFACDGTGYSHPRGQIADAVTAFARARTAAARPKVRQVRAGDTVSPIYREYGKAQWGTVTKVLVARGHRLPSRGPEDPAAHPARVVLDDGRTLEVSTETVLARRNAPVSPAPFVAAALGGAQAGGAPAKADRP